MESRQKTSSDVSSVENQQFSFARLCAFPVLVGLLAFGSVASANEDNMHAKALQAMDCEWWDYVTVFAYEDYDLLIAAEHEDPFSYLKARMEYADYQAFSAGRAMLDAVLVGLRSDAPVDASRADVAALCHAFPPIAVSPEHVHSPMLGETL